MELNWFIFESSFLLGKRKKIFFNIEKFILNINYNIICNIQ